MNQHLKTIIDMFSYKRPMGSLYEDIFVERFLMPLGFQRDEFKNLVLTLGDNPRVLFSSHMDTVHYDEGIQRVKYKKGVLTQNGSNCLGADDTAGIWLMTEMIKAHIPGVYIIHHGEERGCIGSRAKAKGDPEFFANIDIAVAFDRAGYKDIITHQSGWRTASDAFAKSLSEQLGNTYSASPNGAYTDTNEYRELVAECTNLSVGYFSQHTSKERQDVTFLMALREALLQVDWSKLVVERDPKAVDYDDFGYGFWGSGKSSFRRQRKNDLYDLIYDYPRVAESILRAFGVTEEVFKQEIVDQEGVYIAA